MSDTPRLRRSWWMLALAAVLATPLATPAATPQPPKGFVALFNGKDLAGWHGMPHQDPYKLAAMPEAERKALLKRWDEDAKQHWSVQNGELVNDGHGAYATTDKEYGDFELLIDYKTVAKADSGIYLRATPQVQIWDYTKEGGKWGIGADKGSGGLWNNSPGAAGKDPLVLADKPFGEWNSFRIILVGERATVWLNGKLVVNNARMENYYNRKAPLLKKGPIQLQTHGGEIRWRNIYLREIPADEANRLLRQRSAAGFVDMFNGKDFTGWEGPVQNYQVKNGTILCLPHKGGTIFTKQQFGDFIARVEFQLPPGGNNGLAIRYPGTGDSAYVGMCELQILDDDAPKYAKLDPRQFCGSVYGMVPVQRGYLRPVGQWNLMEATVKGSTIRVELNGTRVLDADVSQVTEYMANKAHPGKTNVKGHFGFCGHSDPVAFRNVQVKPLCAWKPFLGCWAVDLPGGGAGWLGVVDNEGQLEASMLWGGGSVLPLASAKVEGGQLVLTRTRPGRGKDAKGKPIATVQVETIKVTAKGDALQFKSETVNCGKVVAKAEFTGKRIPPPPAAPDLKKVKFGQPISLFNGKDLTGWKVNSTTVPSGWKAANGLLINNAPQTPGKPHIRYANLITEREFEDFNLTLEVRVPEKGNSGIYLRGIYEVQVADTFGLPLDSHHMGGIYSRISPSKPAEKPAGEWQTFDITLVDRHVTVVLNGTKIIDNQPVLGCTGGALTSNEFRPGPLYLQGDHTSVEYRNIMLRPVVK